MRSTSIPELIASIPHVAGYQLDERNVAAFVIEDTGRLHHSAVVDHRNDPGSVPALVNHVNGYTDTTAIFATYGEAGEQVATDLQHLTAEHDDALIFNVTDNQVRQLHPDGQWSEPDTLPSPPVEVVMESHAPAPSREALGERFQPLPTPTYEPGPSMDHLMPSERAGWASRTLDALSEPGVQDIPGKQAIVAEAMLSSKAVRDAVLLHARSPEQVEALVQVYRGAPPQGREDLAAAAAMTMYVRNWPRVGVETALSHAGQNNLGRLVNLGIRNDLNPLPLVGDLEQQMPAQLVKADATWEAERAAATRTASFPDRPHTGQHRPDSPGHEPHHSPGAHRPPPTPGVER